MLPSLTAKASLMENQFQNLGCFQNIGWTVLGSVHYGGTNAWHTMLAVSTVHADESVLFHIGI